MMTIFSVLLFFWLQLQTSAPAERVVVGLVDQQQVLVENPRFSGFIQTRSGESVLMYRQENFHGEMPVRSIARIDFGEYRRGMPLQLTVTLKNGQKLEVQTERRDVLMVQGRTDTGMVVIKHPDPLNAPQRLGGRKPNRREDLTISYLEFPAS